MERELDVFMTRDATDVAIGRLRARVRGGRETASFEYAAGWLASDARFELDPELPLGRGQFHTERNVFNVFSDCAPDRWGQTLLRRHERARAKAEGRAPRTLHAIDFVALITRGVARVVGAWKTHAKAAGLTARQIDRMASAFEHDDLVAAQK